MTVKDLIEILETCPQEAVVCSSEDWYPIGKENITVWTIEEMLGESDIKNIDEIFRKGAVYIG